MGFLKILKNITFKSKVLASVGISFDDIKSEKFIYLYAGDIPKNPKYVKFIGLSLKPGNEQHIKHDVEHKIPLPDSCVDVYQSEDVFEHIELNRLPGIINEIYRVLKPNGVFRLSLPDYRCDILYERTIKGVSGELKFDPEGGGAIENGKVIKGGHLWFPRYELVKQILGMTEFTDIKFFHYYDEEGIGITNPIDYSIGHVMRTPDHDERVRAPRRPMSIVVDCIK